MPGIVTIIAKTRNHGPERRWRPVRFCRAVRVRILKGLSMEDGIALKQHSIIHPHGGN